MKKACLLALFQFLLPYVLYAYLLGPRIEAPAGYFIALFPSVLMTVALGLLWQASIHYGDFSLLQKQHAANKDGKRACASGRISPYGPPIVTPTGSESVCCTWGVFHWVRQSKGGPTKSYLGNGHLLTPSYVRTPMGDVRLLGFPKMEGFPVQEFPLLEGESLKRSQAVEYLKALPRREAYTIADFKKAYGEVMDLMRDSDGSVQTEFRQFDFEDLQVKLQYEEQCVPPGSDVCAFGRWDASQNGIVPEEISTGREVTVQKGTAAEVSARLRSSLLKKTIGAVILALVVNLVIGLILVKMPPP